MLDYIDARGEVLLTVALWLTAALVTWLMLRSSKIPR